MGNARPWSRKKEVCPPDRVGQQGTEGSVCLSPPSLAGWGGGPRGLSPLETWKPVCHVPPLPFLVSWPPSLDPDLRGGGALGIT